jgi:hypothetical protein
LASLRADYEILGHQALSHLTFERRFFRDWLSKAVSIRHDSLHVSPLPSSSPFVASPGSLDEELVEAFEHLDLQICTIFDPRPIELHQKILIQNFDPIKQMPSRFSTIREARRYLRLIMCQTHHFLATTWTITDAVGLAKPFPEYAPGEVPVVTGLNIFSTPRIVPLYLPPTQRKYADDLDRWSNGFSPYFAATRSPETSGFRDHIMGTLFQIHAIATRIALAGVLFIYECNYDIFLPQFTEMLDLVHVFVDAYRRRHTTSSAAEVALSLDLGITPPLFLLLMRCRDRALRRHAVSILRNWHAEVCWDPRLIAEIGIFIMEIEEEGNAEGVIPEESRAVITGTSEGRLESGVHHVLLQFVRRRGAPDGGPVWKEKMVYYTTNRSLICNN